MGPGREVFSGAGKRFGMSKLKSRKSGIISAHGKFAKVKKNLKKPRRKERRDMEIKSKLYHGWRFLPVLPTTLLMTSVGIQLYRTFSIIVILIKSIKTIVKLTT